MKKSASGGARSAWIAALIALLALTTTGTARAAGAESGVTVPMGDTAPDPAIRQGVLANGMRFVIVRQGSARRGLSLRLRIGAGSLQEPPGRNGVAHMLEHMAFRGSTHVPDTEIWRKLERLGVAFGADSNAFTTPSQTYFQFDLPDAEPSALAAVLMLMREIASELTLTPKALNDERNVVLAEARLTDSPAAQADQAQTAFWFEDQPSARRDAMGDLAVLQQVSAAELRAFYDAYYRPERASVIVVGDVDPGVVENQIRATFSDWVGRGPAGGDPTPVPRGPDEARAALFVEPGASSSVRLAWLAPSEAAPQGFQGRRKQLLADLAIRVLNRAVNTEDAGNLSAGASLIRRPPVGDITLLSVDGPPSAWRKDLKSMERARRRLLRYGVEQDDVDRAVSESMQALQVASAGADLMPSATIANALVARLDAGEPVTRPAQDLAFAGAVYDHIDTAQVDAAMRDLFSGDGPLVFLASSQPVDGGDAALVLAMTQVEAEPIEAPMRRHGATIAPIWPYAYFGTVGRVMERRDTSDLGVSFVRFENGVRLTVRPSASGGGQILVRVAVGGGRLDLPRDRMTAIWAADSGAIDAGGLLAIDRDQMRQALGASVYGFSFSTTDDGFDLSGATRPADLDVQLQVLAAYATAPGWRPSAFDHIRSLFVDLLPQFEASPGGALGDYVGGLLHGGDPRWSTPTLGDVAAAKARDLRAVLEQPLATGAIEVTVIGDVTVERAIQAVAATFGALPPRPMATAPNPDAYQTVFPRPTTTPVMRYHGGLADQALALAAWPIGDAYADAPSVADARVLLQVLDNRLIERLRIMDGATYTPRTGLDASRTFPGFGYLYAAASVSPDKTELVFERIAAIAADLRTTEIGADELERARRPAVAALRRAQDTDAYWLTALSRAQTDPRRLDLIRRELPNLMSVTPANVRRAAQIYLRDERVWKLVILPHQAARDLAAP